MIAILRPRYKNLDGHNLEVCIVFQASSKNRSILASGVDTYYATKQNLYQIHVKYRRLASSLCDSCFTFISIHSFMVLCRSLMSLAFSQSLAENDLAQEKQHNFCSA